MLTALAGVMLLARWQKYGNITNFQRDERIGEEINYISTIKTSMINRYNNWYKSLTPLKKLIVSFILNWFYWLTAWLIAEQFVFDENRSWKYHVFHATWMSFFMTIPFNWKELKQIFNPLNKKEENSQLDV